MSSGAAGRWCAGAISDKVANPVATTTFAAHLYLGVERCHRVRRLDLARPAPADHFDGIHPPLAEFGLGDVTGRLLEPTREVALRQIGVFTPTTEQADKPAISGIV